MKMIDLLEIKKKIILLYNENINVMYCQKQFCGKSCE